MRFEEDFEECEEFTLFLSYVSSSKRAYCFVHISGFVLKVCKILIPIKKGRGKCVDCDSNGIQNRLARFFIIARVSKARQCSRLFEF